MGWTTGTAAFVFCTHLATGMPAVARSTAAPTHHPYPHSAVDMPVSLAASTVRTPDFAVAKEAYFIMVQVDKPLPFEQMKCMMAVTSNRFDSAGCSSDDPLLRAEWTVWDGDRLVSTGTSTTAHDAKFTKDHIFKFLGMFVAQEAGRRYVVEVKFTRDAAPLNVANPHLIVVPVKDH